MKSIGITTIKDKVTELITEASFNLPQDIIEAIAHGVGPRKYHIALGYAGWGDGQLEEEILSNAWLNGPADEVIVFDEPIDRRWQAAASAMGVELNRLSSDVGHA